MHVAITVFYRSSVTKIVTYVEMRVGDHHVVPLGEQLLHEVVLVV